LKFSWFSHRDKEMADHRRFTLVIDIQVYFCGPR